MSYVLIFSCSLVIGLTVIESEDYRKLAAPLILLPLAIGTLVRLQAADRKRAEPGANPDGGGSWAFPDS